MFTPGCVAFHAKVERQVSLSSRFSALSESYSSILKAWDSSAKCHFVPAESHDQGELSWCGQLFNWDHLSHPGGALLVSVTLHNPVSMNEEVKYM